MELLLLYFQNWIYTYYCDIYNDNEFSNINETMLPIEDTTIDPYSSSCFQNLSG
jgi:hypothetical protein